MSGTTHDVREWLKRAQRGMDGSCAASRRTRLLMPSGPEALAMGNVLRISSTSRCVRRTDVRQCSSGAVLMLGTSFAVSSRLD